MLIKNESFEPISEAIERSRYRLRPICAANNPNNVDRQIVPILMASGQFTDDCVVKVEIVDAATLNRLDEIPRHKWCGRANERPHLAFISHLYLIHKRFLNGTFQRCAIDP